MKNFGLWLLFISLSASFSRTLAQSQGELTAGYYVTVAAYAVSKEDYARRFTDQLISKGLTAEYGFNTKKNLYFVYLSYFTDLKASLVEMEKVRAKGQFTDAWVRVVSGVIAANPVVSTPNTETQTRPTETKEEQVPQPILPAEKQAADTVQQVQTEPPIQDNEPVVQHPVMTLGNTEVFISLFNAANNRVVDGEVQVIDTERTKLLTTVKGNDYITLPDPKSKSGQLTLIGEVFGYRKLQLEINFPLPLADTVKEHIDLMGTSLVVKFDMVRYHKGDIATLFHVYFFNDAAIMLPNSKYELTNLVEMMRENENYRIKLHGHTNGNYHGKILELGPEKNFFSLEGARQDIGSAKDLSFQRAETIKEYLVINGIAADRIEIKAWGGKRALYDKNSTNAKKNVRVEVEVIQE